MIQKSHRFHGYGSLNTVYRCGQTLREPSLTLKFLRRPNGRPTRVAVVVSKKVSKSAVIRNRIRRRIYDLVRLQEKALGGGFDLVFTVFTAELASQSSTQVARTVNTLLRKALTTTMTSGTEPATRDIVKSEGKQ